ncbi:MAG: efflux RND transporter permease subunit [Candidatus Absconditabacteria bacterium]
MYNSETIITKENIIEIIKYEYEKVLKNLNQVSIQINQTFLKENKTHFDGFEKYLGKNNIGIKLQLENSIKKVFDAEKKLKKYDINKISYNTPGIILKEQINEILKLINDGYSSLKQIKLSLVDFFEYGKLENKNDIESILVNYNNLCDLITKDAELFEHLVESQRNYRISKDLLSELRSGFRGFWVKNYKMSFLIIGVIIIAGVYSLLSIPKESSPNIKFGIIGVNTIYEGASPEDVDNLITDKIEKEIENIDGIKKISSNSSLGISSVIVELNNDVDTSKALQDIKDKVDKVSLPSSAEDPSVTEISTNNELMFSYLLYGNKEIFSQAYIEQRARSIKDKLEGKNGIVSIDINSLFSNDGPMMGGGGSDLFKVEIILNKGKIEDLGLSIGQISSIITSFNKNQPLGSFKIGNQKYDYRIQGEFESIHELEDLTIKYENNSVIKLKDIGIVNRVSIDDSIKIMGFNNSTGYNFVGLNFNKKEGGNIFANAKAAKDSIEELLKLEEFKGLQGVYTTDLSELLIEDYTNLGKNGMQTLILVFVTLIFFVGIKESFIASMFLPLAFLITFIVLNILGLSLNFLTNFSLILTLGIAIDTLIVIIEGATEKMKIGYNPMSAVLLAVKEFKFPLMSGTFTTVAAFLPMMFLPGIMGKFLAYIPITIFSTLVAGLFLSLTLLTAVFYIFNKPKKYYGKNENIEEFLLPEEKVLLKYERQGKDDGKPKNRWNAGKILGLLIIGGALQYFYLNVFPTIRTYIVGIIVLVIYVYRDEFFDSISNNYKTIINKLLSRGIYRWGMIFMPVVLLIVSFATVGQTLIANFSLFPAQDVDYFSVNIESKNGITKEYMEQYIPKVEEIISQIPELKNYYISLSSYRIEISIDLIAKLKRKEKGMRNVFDITNDLENKISYLEQEGLKYEVNIASGGPPSGKPIGVQLVSDSNKKFKQLIEVSKEFENYLRGVEGVKNITNSSQETPGQFVFRFDKDKLRSLNLTPGDIMGQVYLSMNGMKSGTLRGEFDDEDIVLKFDEFDDSATPDQIENIAIKTGNGEIKLGSVLDYQFDNSVASISRENGKITIKVEADTQPDAPTLEIQTNLTEFAENYQYPEGISFMKGGENEENMDLIIATGVSFLIALILIFTTLVLQFSSYSQPLIILYSVLLALLGVNIGLYVTGNAYSMTFGIGFISLTGIVVNDAILLIETINQNIKKGLEFVTALIESGKSRLQPIMVTTLTTCFGLLPIAMQDEFWAGLGYTVVFGLAMGSFFTLFVTPILYYENVNIRKKIKKIAPGLKTIFQKN